MSRIRDYLFLSYTARFIFYDYNLGSSNKVNTFALCTLQRSVNNMS
ncbi:hypothetical protein BACUNI_02781 [Bacteroides uniformis ATCC 8492]|uniref:Uncharacterized protein n=1 Tax=Bacteroides uniformis (strain ATCC 8492 / DSM 6597 / CCUG 4942 / CIP 103695 / JCM 5828 / KCTC 5204 / NCTC 13054 / VPI 0061) TaxID=411479 RepID=A0ABC9NAI0_BACUC|nr:hypothetical protein BACUNI_02781 [Bacteroides uniformis ATCC 8492]